MDRLKFVKMVYASLQFYPKCFLILKVQQVSPNKIFLKIIIYYYIPLLLLVVLGTEKRKKKKREKEEEERSSKPFFFCVNFIINN